MARVDAAESLAQKRPSGLEKEAMKAVRGPALEAVRLRLQKASFQHRMTERSAVEAMPGSVSGKRRWRIWAPTLAPSMRPASRISCGTSLKKEKVSTASEIWRYQDETGASVEEIDAVLKEQTQMPMGPFLVADMSGLDTTVKVARDLQDAYGDRFYVHQAMTELVEKGQLGAKSGKGFYEHA